ncbi:hypothetical protein BS47DRAFT_1390025 [Hydnum rufescens UP504]|uniref:Uncharacterized protein n=1 Tax=Hydnum rufescens UP504 TaxID=1448309 RepID=A0A9P6B4H3_9AGAM|nr:hypothetical protein BS47DRAFT_1390025 [Hydnum rufescens UP504]
MVQPAPVDFAPTSGIAGNIHGPMASSSRVEELFHTHRNGTLKEKANISRLSNPSSRVIIPLSVVVQRIWHMAYHLELHARELADNGDVQMDETLRRVLRSQHFSNVERWVIDTPGSTNASTKGFPDNQPLECGSCYREQLDGGRKTNWEYTRRELNALVLTSTKEGWVSHPDDEISKNQDRLDEELEQATPGEPSEGDTWKVQWSNHRVTETPPYGVYMQRLVVVFRDKTG